MHERIKELAEQASHQSPDGYPVTIPYSNDFVKVFAELIVRECVDVVADAVDQREPASTYIGKIKEHFGVEE